MGFHVVEGVEQALGSVAVANDATNMVIFDSSGEYEGSRILDVNSPEGQAIHINTDYFGNNRPIHPFPGPYEIKKSKHRIKLWPK